MCIFLSKSLISPHSAFSISIIVQTETPLQSLSPHIALET